MRTYNFTSRSHNHFRFRKIMAFVKRHSVATWLFRATTVGLLAVALLFVYYSFTLPDPNRLLSRSVPESTKIFARDGSTIYEVHGEVKRTLVDLDYISPYVKNATIAIEDKDFYKHGGISITGLVRSVIVDIFKGRKEQGGSTITQQFIKNAVLSREKAFTRKIKEIILAIEINARFSKDDVLKLYLNEIPYGKNAYGVEAAAQTYFGKTAQEVSLAESAYLAAIVQAPSYYNPLGPNRTILDKRKNYVLQAMRDQGYITDEEQKTATAEKVSFSSIKTAITAPHFVLYVQDYLANKYGEKTLEEGGLKVYTTLDPQLQSIAEEAVKTGVEKTTIKYNANNAGLVAIDPKTGQILAMVGSRDYFAESQPAGCRPGKDCLFEPNVNVTLAERQPGSSFKPYAYVTAFGPDYKYNPASMLLDVTTNFGKYGNKDYMPHNYDGKNYGPVSMRQALAGSLNIPAVKTVALVGPENVVQTARSLGITSPLRDCGLALVLGGCEVKLIDHVAAFSALATGGVRHEKTPILKILDKDDNLVEEYQDSSQQVLDPQAVYELVSIMTDNSARAFIFGSNSPLILPGRPVAAKTGTTNEWKDGWTLGFTPQLAAGVWTGNNDGTLLKRGADGIYVAAPIWNQFMREALKNQPVENFQRPAGIKEAVVDVVSGKLPTQYTPGTKTEIFADYAIPTDYDDVHVAVKFDFATGRPATELTPPEQVVYQPYTVLHSERPDSPNWEDPVRLWAQQQGYVYPNDTGGATPPQTGGTGPVVDVTEPDDNTTITQLPLRVTVNASAPAGMARLDLAIDGQFVQSLTASPFVFSINRQYSDGQHSIVVHAVANDGTSTDTSTVVTFALKNHPPPNHGLPFPGPIINPFNIER